MQPADCSHQRAEPDSAVASPPALSAELFVIPLTANRHLVYAPLRQAAFVANAALVNILADVRDGRFDPSADPDGSLMAFLRRMQVVDGGEERRPITVFTGDPQPTAVTLFMTTACNLRCTYCYAAAGDTPVRTMPFDVARRGIDFVIANARRKGEPGIEVAFHGGGEPTVNWKVLTESLAYARSRGAECGIHVDAALATNGVLSDSQVDWVVANMDGASVSFDGLPAVHDANRLGIGGRGSSERVIHTLRRFDDAGFPYGIRVTVTADQIPRLADSIGYICAEFGTPRIQVEPAYQMGRWKDAPSAETAAFVEGYRAAQRRAAACGKEISFSAARVGILTNHFCGVTQDSFCLSPDGNVSGCYEVFSEQNPWASRFFYGAPDRKSGKYVFRLEVLDDLRGQAVQNRAFCGGCFARWSCGGDCFHKSLTVNGDGAFAGTDRCHIIRELTKDQILANVARAGGLFWHEPPSSGDEMRSAGKEMLL